LLRPLVVRGLLAQRHEMPPDRFKRTLDDLVLFAPILSPKR
jgi:hypothetical protein